MLGLGREDFLKLGASPTDPPSAGFNMTAFALRLSAYHNGVSRKHGEARRMWQPLWSDLPVEQVPIDHITNGVHVPTWIEPKMELACNHCLGSDWLADHDNPVRWTEIASFSVFRVKCTRMQDQLQAPLMGKFLILEEIEEKSP